MANNFNKWHHWNMVASDQQYGNNDIHIHPDSWSVCNHNDQNHHYQSERNTNVCSCWALLFRCNDPGVANYFYQ